jgi:hypothetical protein
MDVRYICDFATEDEVRGSGDPVPAPKPTWWTRSSGNSFTPPRGSRTTLFPEPRLVSGLPDLVAVTWHVPTTERWTGARHALSTSDLRLVQLLVSHGETTEKELRELAGRDALRAIVRLEAAGLVVKREGAWRVRRLKDAFAVRGIVAFEAKITDWANALAQARQNTWFASESYVLVSAGRRPRRCLRGSAGRRRRG